MSANRSLSWQPELSEGAGPLSPPALAVAAIGERLLGRVDKLAGELTRAIRRAEPFYRTSGLVPVEDLRASMRDGLVDVLGKLSGRAVPGRGPPRETDRRRAEQGVPLPVIVHAHRAAGR